MLYSPGIIPMSSSNTIISTDRRTAIPRKSAGMHNTSGGIAYNLLVDPLVGVVAKGMNDVRIYNNTFYSTKSQAEIWRGLIDIHKNTDDGQDIPPQEPKSSIISFILKRRE